MPETLTLSGMSPARPPAPLTDPLELVGCSALTLRLQELARRAVHGLCPGPAPPPSRAPTRKGVVRDPHARRAPGALLVGVTCADADGARLERLLFGPPDAASPPDLEVCPPTAGGRAGARAQAVAAGPHETVAALQDARARHAGRRGAGQRRAGGHRPLRRRAPPLATPRTATEHRFRADLYRLSPLAHPRRRRCGSGSDDLPALAARLLQDTARRRGGPRAPSRRRRSRCSCGVVAGQSRGSLRDVVERVARSCAHAPAGIFEHVLPAMQLYWPRGVCAVRQPA